MQQQPAQINYFFSSGYVKLGRTIAMVWRLCIYFSGDALKYATKGFRRNFVIAPIKIVFALLFSLFLFIFSLALIAVVSSINLAFLLPITAIIFVIFKIVAFFDANYVRSKKILCACPACQREISMPKYVCECGNEHTNLIPSKYGILKRKCDCGKKIPTTIFNGRGELDAYCPFESSVAVQLENSGYVKSITIPILGGTDAGKTCLINTAISQLKKSAQGKNLIFEDTKNGLERFKKYSSLIQSGELPPRTNDNLLSYYQFLLTPKHSKIKTLVSLCDSSGAAVAKGLEAQEAFRTAKNFLLVVDPLAITAFRKELIAKDIELDSFCPSTRPIDEVIGSLITVVSNCRSLSVNNKINANLAIVFSKLDIPTLEEQIGKNAVTKYAKEHRKTHLEAQTILCKEFLNKYDEQNFVNMTSRFSNSAFFVSSALGRASKALSANGVREPVLWLLFSTDKAFGFNKNFY